MLLLLCCPSIHWRVIPQSTQPLVNEYYCCQCIDESIIYCFLTLTWNNGHIIVTPWLRNFFLPKEHSCLLSYSPCHVAVVFMSVHSLQFHVQPIISSKVILLYHNTKLFSITSLDLSLPIFPSKLPVSATYSDFLFLITCPKKCKLSFLFFT